eukprot:225860_1
MESVEHPPPDYVGYGNNPPSVVWPNGARVCISFVINYEEGGERNILNGDDGSEAGGTELIGGDSIKNGRSYRAESNYEYGSRSGIYRILSLFRKHDIQTTIYAVGKALEVNPSICKLFVNDNHDIASHQYRWFNYNDLSYNEEKKHLLKTMNVHKQLCNYTPKGMYVGAVGSMTNNTKKILYQVNRNNLSDRKILWHSDHTNDDIPYWDYNGFNLYGDKKNGEIPLLNIPYALDTNDFRFLLPSGYVTSDQFYNYCRDAFDCLLQEGGKMMSIGLHSRIIGHPGRLMGLKRFIQYIMNDKFQDKVWIATRTQIAQFWMKNYPPNLDKKQLKTLCLEYQTLVWEGDKLRD